MTLTRYRMMRETIGLTQLEAARLHDVPIDTISKWDRGKSRTPAGVIREMQDLALRIDAAGAELARQVRAVFTMTTVSGAGAPRIGIPAKPEDAYAHGFPSQATMIRAIGAAVLGLPSDVAIEFVRIGDGEQVTARLAAPAVAN